MNNCFAKAFSMATQEFSQQNISLTQQPLVPEAPECVDPDEGVAELCANETPAKASPSKAVAIASSSTLRAPTPSSAGRTRSQTSLVATPTPLS